MISVEKLKKYANDLEFTMEESEYETLKEEFEVLLSQVDLISKIKDIDKYEPMDFPFPLEDACLREDIVSMSLSSSDAFSNSEYVENNSIKVPKVVE